MDWDDIKVMLALCRCGSARAAAQQLGVSNSTVTRRLDELERALQTRLFDRTPDGYRMTAAAEQLLPVAEHVEELVLAAERQLTGGDQNLQGSIRLTMPEGVDFLMARLARFAEDYPGIDLELMPSFDTLDLSRREADIAIRVMPAGVRPPEYLIGRHVATLSTSTYVHRELLNPDNPADVSHLGWIGKNPVGQREEWLAQTQYPQQPVRHAIRDYRLLYKAVQCRMGMAYMPCYLAHRDRDVVRVPEAPIVHTADIWVLTHKDLRMSARMRVLREIIAKEFERIRPSLDTRPQP